MTGASTGRKEHTGHNGDVTGTGLLEVRDLTVAFQRPREREPFRAVDDVSLSLSRGQTLGIVGESGSGKSTLALSILGMAPVTDGEIRFEDRDITHLSARARRTLSREIQVVFQDPYSSINPARTIEQTLVEPLLVHEQLTKTEQRNRVREILERVGLPADSAQRYPAEFSGGQRQRIAIARALIVAPKLVLCDEAVSALDLSVQAQVLNLLVDLQQQLGLAYLFISHNLAVVRHIASHVAVLYRGQVMESGPTKAVSQDATHPYTQALLAATPSQNPRDRKPAIERSAAPAAMTASTVGCPYQARCPHVMDICKSVRPEPRLSASGALVACHLVSSNTQDGSGGRRAGDTLGTKEIKGGVGGHE
jgi:peptide/nickel transport system ATP-binding protein